MTQVSDPDLWMNLHHHVDEDEDSEESAAEETELDDPQLRFLQALDSDDDDRVSNPAIAMWLIARLERKIAGADETTRAAYFPLADRISNAIRNLSEGDAPGSTADLRRTLRQFCILSPRELSPTNSLTPNQIGEEIVQNYNNEFMNTHGDEAEEHQPTRSRS